LNKEDIAEAFIYFGKAVLKIKPMIGDCKNCVGIIAELEKMALVFSNPVTAIADIGKNIFWHFFDITHDIKEARSNWD